MSAARPTVNYLNLNNASRPAVDVHDDIMLVSMETVPNKVCGMVDGRTGQYHLTAVYNVPAPTEDVSETKKKDATADAVQPIAKEVAVQSVSVLEQSSNGVADGKIVEVIKTDAEKLQTTLTNDVKKPEIDDKVTTTNVIETEKPTDDKHKTSESSVAVPGSNEDKLKVDCDTAKISSTSSGVSKEPISKIELFHFVDKTKLEHKPSVVDDAAESKVKTVPVPIEKSESIVKPEPVAVQTIAATDPKVIVTYAATTAELYVPGSEPV